MTAPDETVLTFGSGGTQLVGILSHADPRAATNQHSAGVGVVIVVGGPQYRAGSHRQFVQLARALAAAGYCTLRFDSTGMGDSSGALPTFEDLHGDIDAAVGALLLARPALCQVVLWGLCDGASAALLYLHRRPDPRVAGLALLNPWVRSEASLAKTHVKHYYLQRLQERAFWDKLLSGKVAASAVSGLWQNLRAAFGGGGPGGKSGGPARGTDAPYQERMALAWADFAGPTLLLLSESDLTAREFVEFSNASTPWQRALRQRPPQRVMLHGADHTCSAGPAQQAMENATIAWLAGIAPAAPASQIHMPGPA